MKKIFLLFYYAFFQYIPMQLMLGYRIGYILRRFVVKCILGNRCGNDVIVKDRCYFGNVSRLTVGDRSQMGQNARFQGTIQIGNDYALGHDVVMMATNHEFSSLDIPINR